MTNTYSTGNPLGSTDPRDLLDNASNLDDAMNSALPTFPDRFGTVRDTYQGQQDKFSLAQAGREADFQQFLTDSGFVSLGNYAGGISVTAYNEYVAFGGFFYRPKPSTVPFVTSGTWVGDDENKFSLFSPDDVLRQDLADDTDTSKGASLIGLNSSTLRGFYGERVSIEAYGVVPGGDAYAAFVAAKLDLVGTDKVLHLPNAVYTLSNTIDLSGLNVYSDGCQLLKQHNGVGIVCQGLGPDFFDFEGVLYIDGDGVAKYDSRDLIAPFSTTEHGVHFNGNSFRVRGRIYSRYHAGDSFRYTCIGNMNRSSADSLWGFFSNRNHYFEGTQDDFSVITLKLYGNFCWAEGFSTSADFSGRGCECYFYNESSSQNGTSDGVYLGKWRSSRMWIYSEPSATSGVGVNIAAACDLLEIEETRGGAVTNASTTTQITLGGQAYPRGNTPVVVTDRFPVTADPARVYTKRVQGLSLAPLADHLYRADGQYQVRASQIGGTKTNRGGWRYDRYIQENFGGPAIVDYYGINGTEAVVAAIVAGNSFFELNGHLKSAVGYSNGFRLRAVADVVGPTTSSTCSAIVSLSNASATPVDMFKLYAAGDAELLIAGKGLIVKTPDGTKSYKISVDNAGTIISTLV